MTFTKKKLAAVVSGSLLMGVGIQQVHATVNLNNNGTTAANPSTFASEIIVAGTGVTLVDAATVLDVSGTMNANRIPNNTDIRVTLTLGGNATFAAQPALSIDDGSGGSGCINGTGTAANVACFAMNVFSGGTTADNTVTFDTNTGTYSVAAGAFANFNVNNLNITGQAPITASLSVRTADNIGPVDLPGISNASYI